MSANFLRVYTESDFNNNENHFDIRNSRETALRFFDARNSGIFAFLQKLIYGFLALATAVDFAMVLRTNLLRVAFYSLTVWALDGYDNVKSLAKKSLAIASNIITVLSVPMTAATILSLAGVILNGTIGSLFVRGALLVLSPLTAIPNTVLALAVTVATIFAKPLNAMLAKEGLVRDRAPATATSDVAEDYDMLCAQSAGAAALFVMAPATTLVGASVVGAVGMGAGASLLNLYRANNASARLSSVATSPVTTIAASNQEETTFITRAYAYVMGP